MLANNTNGYRLTSISCVLANTNGWSQQWQPQKHTHLQTLPENNPRLVKRKVLHFFAPSKARSLHYTKEWPHSRPSYSWHLNIMPCKFSFQQLWLCFEGLWLCPESQCFVWNIVIKGCLGNNELIEAISFYHRTVWANSRPNKFIYPTLFKASTIACAIQECLKFY